MLRILGIRGRLLLAFLGITAFALVAALTAAVAVFLLGNALTQVVSARVPVALTAQRISRQAERIVAEAPKLLTDREGAARPGAAAPTRAGVRTEMDRLVALFEELRQQHDDTAFLDPVEDAVQDLGETLFALERVVERQGAARDRVRGLVSDLGNVMISARRLLTPGLLVLESDFARIRNALDADAPAGTIVDTTRNITELHPLERASSELSTINDTLLRVALSRESDLPLLNLTLERSLDALEDQAALMDEALRPRMFGHIRNLRDLVDGANSLLAARDDELAIASEGQDLLAQNEALSRTLIDLVDEVIMRANVEMRASANSANDIRRWSSVALALAVLLGVVFSTLIVWLYVGRVIVGRLSTLSQNMMAIASGNLEREVSIGGDDELSRMADALGVFRRTAIEMRETNLREIRDAQQRLSDAIESLSDGFSLFDSQDRLIICNSQYRTAIYPELADLMQPGVQFENIVQAAADRGLVTEASADPKTWVSERIDRHRNPDGPILQQQTDKRWIRIEERRTEGGGTVAIYTDVTELKDRERQLAEKSTALERVSAQLAKFIPQQVYGSISADPAEARIQSKRKKLTVFFSDIAGFTETADQLEAEELTWLINRYLTEMSQIATDHGGTIDKYIGDGMMVFFGDPESRGVKQDALDCVRMAIAMREQMKQLAEVWREAGIERALKVRMGIHTDTCTVGNFGSDMRMEYTIMGNGANTASRLETAATPGEILISHETYMHVRNEFLCEQAGSIAVKGIAYPLTTYRVVDAYADLDRQAHQYREVHPTYSIQLNLEAMSMEELAEAQASLEKGLELITTLRPCKDETDPQIS